MADADITSLSAAPAERLLVLLCTYNERENVERLIPEILAVLPTADILVVDDGSPDGTGAYVAELAANDSRLRLLQRGGKQGLGSAVIAGFEFAFANRYELLLTLDADRSHPARYIPDLLSLMDRADVAIGSRYVPGGGIVGWGLRRKWMSRCINWYSRLFLGLPNKDNSGNFRCYRVAKLAELDLALVRGTGYAFMEEILFRCHRIGCRFAETPIVFEDRQVGESKINLREAVRALWVIFLLFLDRLVGARVRKIE